MAGNALRTYLNVRTGVVDVYPESLAEVYPDLIEVDESQRTLINPPASDATLEGLRDRFGDKGDSDTDQGDEPGEGDK